LGTALIDEERWAERETDRRTHNTKLIDCLHYYAKTPKKYVALPFLRCNLKRYYCWHEYLKTEKG
jgi:hypothetical protein